MADRPGLIRVGTRGSALALWQADLVIACLRLETPACAAERVIFTTTGDRRLDRPLAEIGDKGLFTAELEAALRDGAIDLAVHSLKDLPTAMPPGLTLGAVLPREDPRDALLCCAPMTLAQLPAGARVGTSSLRRRAQLLARRPDLRVVDMRGNVPTRVEALERGLYDAIVLAWAGVKRLGLTGRVTELLAHDDMLPAVGQGAVAVQARVDDAVLARTLAQLDHRPTRLAISAERALLASVEGGCQIPLGALARLDRDSLELRALIADLEGTQVIRAARNAMVADVDDAESLGRTVAADLIAAGARPLLDRARTTAPDLAPNRSR